MTWRLDNKYTKALLHFNGSDASITFTDETGKTWTANGNAQIDTAQSVFGGASGLFDGTGDYLSTSDSDDFAFGTGDFTIDLRVRFNVLPTSITYKILFSQHENSSNYYIFGLYNNAGTYQFEFFQVVGGAANIDILKNANSIATGVWYHVALVRSGNNWYIFQDGTQLGSTVVDADSVSNFSASPNIGRWAFDTSYDFNGWIDEFRISKGIARWTANFTPPTKPYFPNTPIREY